MPTFFVLVLSLQLVWLWSKEIERERALAAHARQAGLTWVPPSPLQRWGNSLGLTSAGRLEGTRPAGRLRVERYGASRLQIGAVGLLCGLPLVGIVFSGSPVVWVLLIAWLFISSLLLFWLRIRRGLFLHYRTRLPADLTKENQPAHVARWNRHAVRALGQIRALRIEQGELHSGTPLAIGPLRQRLDQIEALVGHLEYDDEATRLREMVEDPAEITWKAALTRLVAVEPATEPTWALLCGLLQGDPTRAQSAADQLVAALLRGGLQDRARALFETHLLTDWRSQDPATQRATLALAGGIARAAEGDAGPDLPQPLIRATLGLAAHAAPTEEVEGLLKTLGRGPLRRPLSDAVSAQLDSCPPVHHRGLYHRLRLAEVAPDWARLGRMEVGPGLPTADQPVLLYLLFLTRDLSDAEREALLFHLIGRAPLHRDCVVWLGVHGSRRAVGPLRGLLYSIDTEVQHAARQALLALQQRIGHQPGALSVVEEGGGLSVADEQAGRLGVVESS